MELARKVTPAFLTAGHNLRGLEDKVYLGRIYGIISAVEKTRTQFGLVPKYVGEFVGRRADGKEVIASSCFIEDGPMVKINELLKSDAPVKFCIDVFAKDDLEFFHAMEPSSLQKQLDFAKEIPLPGQAAKTQEAKPKKEKSK